MKKTIEKKKPKIFIGKSGTGKTYNAEAEINMKDYVIFQANDIDIEDVYSWPMEVGIIIEDVDYKPDKEKIIDLIHSGRNIVLTSKNKKDVPKAIINSCTVKLCGKLNRTQFKIKTLYAKNCDEVNTFEANMWSLTGNYIKMKDRDDFYRGVRLHEPPPMQILSWASASMPNNNKLAFVASTLHRWPTEYFYALLAYSWEGGYVTMVPPKRKSSSLYPSICKKLGLKPTEAYLIIKLTRNAEYAKWAATKLLPEECKVLGIKKERRKRITMRKTKGLEEYL
jgi:hypothetical protein